MTHNIHDHMVPRSSLVKNARSMGVVSGFPMTLMTLRIHVDLIEMLRFISSLSDSKLITTVVASEIGTWLSWLAQDQHSKKICN